MTIIYITTALSAAAAAVFAGLTWRQSKKFWERENLSKQAYITPADNPGKIQYEEGLESTNPVINIKLINTGDNPCTNIKILMLAYNNSVIEDNSDVIFPLYTHMSNPLPKNGKLWINVTNNQLRQYNISEMNIRSTSIVTCRIEYQDVRLQETFENIFYWQIGTEHRLEEIDPLALNKIRKKIQNDLLRLWT
ncbi:hypothetical protein HQ531_15280 [bacterium]|nr:hypothetical protein [bacterium]